MDGRKRVGQTLSVVDRAGLRRRCRLPRAFATKTSWFSSLVQQAILRLTRF